MVGLFIMMGMYMMVNGKMIGIKEEEYLNILVGQSIKVNGNKVNRKDKVMKSGLMDYFIKDRIKMG